MSIPIAARRYISDLGLTSRKWKREAIGLAADTEAFLVTKGPDDFYLLSAFYNGSSWVAWHEDYGHYPVTNIVCWSEIKT